MRKQEDALAEALALIEKEHGKGSIYRMGDKEIIPIDVIPTGNLALDIALGVGGYARGRIVEIVGPESSGKSTLALHATKEVQKLGEVVAYIDTEHALDPKYAQDIGVDVDSMLISQPDCGEDALEIALKLVKSGAVALVVIDSVAALTPRAEIEGSIGDSHVGLQARMMSQAMRLFASAAHNTNTCVIFINQIREKIGVIYGCFSYTTRVLLADGSTEKIGKIVNQKLPLEVISYNELTGALEPKKIIGWHNNGTADHFLQITTNARRTCGRSRFGCTPDHSIFTPTGTKAAKDLVVGDDILAAGQSPVYSDDALQVIIGSLLGDGSVRKNNLRMGHGSKQLPYLEFKRSFFENASNITTGANTGKSSGFEFSIRLPAHLYDIAAELSGTKRRGAGGRSAPQALLDQLDARGIAVLCMDDGTFGGSHAKWGHGKFELSIKSLDQHSREQLAKTFDRLGAGLPTIRDSGSLLWSGERTAQLFGVISPYVPECMRYKLVERDALPFSWDHDNGVGSEWVTYTAKVLDIHIKPQTANMGKFDLTIEDNHTYVVDRTVVHNSNETSPGGRALRFYASQRLDVRRKTAIKDGTDTIGNETRVKIVKNKVAPPFKECEFEIVYGEGISQAATLLELGIRYNLIKKQGNTYYDWNGEKFGVGRAKAVAYLKDATVSAELYPKVLEAIKSPPQAPQVEELDD